MDKTRIAQLPALDAPQGVASGIAAVELSAEELDRVTGGATKGRDPLVTNPTNSYGVEDDCGRDG